MTGKDKKLNYPIYKAVKVNEEQNKKWDSNTPKLIRNLLEGKLAVNDSEVMPRFKRLYEIMNLYFIGKLTPEKISEIPNSILKEIELIEEEFNFE